jgi:glyoxylase-like metal-dependent hydrolase (beta-lactamase superfamily II)
MVEPDMFKNSPPDGFRPESYTIKPTRANRQLKDGDVLKVGHRTLTVLHTPGHSPGSICLWEEDRGFLFSGDTLYDGPIYAHLPHSNFDDYLQSLSMLCSHVPKINKILPSHGPTPLEPMFCCTSNNHFFLTSEITCYNSRIPLHGECHQCQSWKIGS